MARNCWAIRGLNSTVLEWRAPDVLHHCHFHLVTSICAYCVRHNANQINRAVWSRWPAHVATHRKRVPNHRQTARIWPKMSYAACTSTTGTRTVNLWMSAIPIGYGNGAVDPIRCHQKAGIFSIPSVVHRDIRCVWPVSVKTHCSHGKYCTHCCSQMCCRCSLALAWACGWVNEELLQALCSAIFNRTEIRETTDRQNALKARLSA